MSSSSTDVVALARQEAFKDFSFFDEETVPMNNGMNQLIEEKMVLWPVTEQLICRSYVNGATLESARIWKFLFYTLRDMTIGVVTLLYKASSHRKENGVMNIRPHSSRAEWTKLREKSCTILQCSQ
ncbi:hypothetical protein G5I_01504 [Acromyrmex echinatior]|uniref:Uncharacterized protein n=1 Tax=Acromyrmex echinatior TaxID=103372 RepID=F4W7T0_ACREC|nr:hypothetical protein G5I_01504 [Acromyrmex echinatior]